MKSREERINERISIYRSNKSELPIKQARDDHSKWTQISNWAGVIWSVLVALLLAFFPVSTTKFLDNNNIIDCIVFILALSFILFSAKRAAFFSSVVRTIENQGRPVTEDYDALIAFHSFTTNTLFGFTQIISKIDPKPASRSKVMIPFLYDALRGFFSEDDLTVNLYDLQNDMIRMIETFRPPQFVGGEIENSLLYINMENGIPIDDARIREYYCVRCLRGVVAGTGQKYVLPNWTKILLEFKTHQWTNKEKRDIIRKDDRQRCIEAGFPYNQYFGILFHPDESVIAFLEIIANGNTALRSGPPTSFASKIQNRFIPCLRVIWQEST